MMLNMLPMIIGAGSLVAGTVGIYQATYAVRSQWLGPTDWHGRRDTRSVALTFDDGPAIETERILDILAEHRLHATFFMIVKHVERLPNIVRRVAAQEQKIGNHAQPHCLFLLHRSRASQRQ